MTPICNRNKQASGNPSMGSNGDRGEIRRRAFGSGTAVPIWAGGLLVLLCAAVYGATLDTGLQPHELHGGDLITHQYAQVQGRPSNAPGYPLYTMGGWLWFHGLHGLADRITPTVLNPTPWLSSYSTLWALLAIGVLYLIGLRLTYSPQWPHGNWPVAWLVSAFYAVTYFFWYYATTTEQYSSAVAHTLAIVYVYLVWRDSQGVQADKRLILLAFLCGLTLAHMLTIALLVPGMVAAILWERPRLLRRPWLMAQTVAGAALPLLAYLFVYVRGAQHPEWRGAGEWANVNEWFWAFVSTAQGREELGWAFEPGTTFFANGFPHLIWQELSIPLVVIGLLGILLFDGKLRLMLYSAIGTTLLFSWAYRYGNWYQVILPAYPLILLGDVAAADWWMRRFTPGRLAAPTEIASGPRSHAAGTHRRVRVMVGFLPLLLMAGLIVWRVDQSLPAANSRGRDGDTALDHAALLLDQSLPANGGLFAAVDDALALQYLIDIWGIYPAGNVVSSPAAATALAEGESVLSTTEAAATLMDELPTLPRVTRQMVSPDWVLFSTGDPHLAAQESQATTGVDYAVAPGIRLAEMTAWRAPTGSPVLADVDERTHAGVDVRLVWELEEPWPADWAISVRPTWQGAQVADATGAIIQSDRARPGHALWSLADIPPGSTTIRVPDAYRLPGAGAVDGVLVIVYRTTSTGFENVAELTVGVPAPLGN